MKAPHAANPTSEFSPARNACKLCAPLGACVAFKGVRGAVPFLHGSQGCATYIRRYLISHFREPVDIASSSFSEEAAVFGGRSLIIQGIRNVKDQYDPEMVGVASTCLAETIGEDLPFLMRETEKEFPEAPPLVSVSTPSYRGTHITGFQDAVRSLVDRFAEGGPRGSRTILLPGFVSPADLRGLKETAMMTGFEADLLPDYSDTLDGGSWDSYRSVPSGGTPLSVIRSAGRAQASLELGGTLAFSNVTPGALLFERFGVERVSLGLPIGLAATDAYFAAVERLSGRRVNESILSERARLVDAYVDGHKYLYGLKVVVFGDPDITAALAGFLFEIGAKPVLCATGSEGGAFEKAIRKASPDMKETPLFMEGADYQAIEDAAKPLKPDLLVGPSKGFTLEQSLGAPLLRVGFPVHDRFGSGRIKHLGYGGTMELFDRLVNSVLEGRQRRTPIGNSYQ